MDEGRGNQRPGTSSLWIMGLTGLVIVAPLLIFAGYNLFPPPLRILEDTEIDPPAGPVRIEHLHAGQEVWTRGTSGTRGRGRVVSNRAAEASEWLDIALDDGTVLRTTALHHVATADNWKAARELKPGDRVMTRGAARTVATVRTRKGSLRLFNLQVDPDEGYFAAGVLVYNRFSTPRNAAASLKTLAIANADLRTNDRDDNKVNDYWVGDVSGLYWLARVGGSEIMLIEMSIATADARPRPVPGGHPQDPFAPKAGYAFRALTYYEDRSGRSVPYDTGDGRNPSAFGFAAYPADYRLLPAESFIINERGTVHGKDLKGAIIDTYPFDPLAEGWSVKH